MSFIHLQRQRSEILGHYKMFSGCFKFQGVILRCIVSFALGRWVEDHEVVHNMMFDTKTNLKLLYKQTLRKSEWWDNGVLPLWITAQNQVTD